MKADTQYPRDYQPPHRGRCEGHHGTPCGRETRGATPRWLSRCPEHWQALLKLRER